MLEFDLLIFSFGQLPLALMTWVPMFLSTLLLPYQAMRLWTRPRTGAAWILSVGLACVLLVAHTTVLWVLPVYVAMKYQLPPASSSILVFEQVTSGAHNECTHVVCVHVCTFSNGAPRTENERD